MVRLCQALLPTLVAVLIMIGAASMAGDNNSRSSLVDPALLPIHEAIDPKLALEVMDWSEVRLRPWDTDTGKALHAYHRGDTDSPAPLHESDAAINELAMDSLQEEWDYTRMDRNPNAVQVMDILEGFDDVPQRPAADLECLTYTLYFEARGESINGQRAVADVVLNRKASRQFPNTICGVTHQGGSNRYQCQFTYLCDGIEETIREIKVYYEIGRLSSEILASGNRVDKTKGATHYHTVNVRPDWADSSKRTTRIGSHIFYKI